MLSHWFSYHSLSPSFIYFIGRGVFWTCAPKLLCSKYCMPIITCRVTLVSHLCKGWLYCFVQLLTWIYWAIWGNNNLSDTITCPLSVFWKLPVFWKEEARRWLMACILISEKLGMSKDMESCCCRALLFAAEYERKPSWSVSVVSLRGGELSLELLWQGAGEQHHCYLFSLLVVCAHKIYIYKNDKAVNLPGGIHAVSVLQQWPCHLIGAWENVSILFFSSKHFSS